MFKIEKQDGGIVPCLLSVFDLRLGYMANENEVGIYPEDFAGAVGIIFFIPVIGQVAGIVSLIVHLYFAYTGYNAGKSIESGCIGFLGWKTANMMGRTKGRVVEWLSFVPFVNLYSLFVIISETTSGKKWSRVEIEEKLSR